MRHQVVDILKMPSTISWLEIKPEQPTHPKSPLFLMASVIHAFDYTHVWNLCHHKLQQSYRSTYNPYVPSQ
jgi:hypothetical protein